MSTEKTDKRALRGEATRQQLLEAATRLFASHGYEGTSIEAILNACNISRGALYHHFENKEQLFEAVFEAVEKQVTVSSANATLKETDPVKRLHAGCHAFLAAAQDESFRKIALVDAPLVLGWDKWRAIEANYGLGMLKAGLTSALAAKGKTMAAVDEAAHLLLAALIEAALLIARASDKRKTAKACSKIIDGLVDGIIG
jgi:AcrR family transcriptional regulator